MNINLKSYMGYMSYVHTQLQHANFTMSPYILQTKDLTVFKRKRKIFFPRNFRISPPGDMSVTNQLNSHAVSGTRNRETRCIPGKKTLNPRRTSGHLEFVDRPLLCGKTSKFSLLPPNVGRTLHL